MEGFSRTNVCIYEKEKENVIVSDIQFVNHTYHTLLYTGFRFPSIRKRHLDAVQDQFISLIKKYFNLKVFNLFQKNKVKKHAFCFCDFLCSLILC